MAEPVDIDCKILRFEDNPKGGQNCFVKCSIGQRTWVKEVWLNYDRPISTEEFRRDLAKHIWPKDEADNLRFVKEEADAPFKLSVTKKP